MPTSFVYPSHALHADCDTPARDRGLKFVSKDRHKRFKAIADELAETSYDVIALQEVWVRADYELIRSKVAPRLPYAKLFYAWVGAHCCISGLSPITIFLHHVAALSVLAWPSYLATLS